jgi:hypothetical protein
MSISTIERILIIAVSVIEAVLRIIDKYFDGSSQQQEG